MRKYENKKRKLAESENGDQASSVVMVTPPKIGRPKKADFWNAVPICVGVTESIQKEHMAELHKEWNKVLSIQDSEKIKELMISTYEIYFDIRNILTTTIYWFMISSIHILLWQQLKGYIYDLRISTEYGMSCVKMKYLILLK